ncbi:MAG: HD domain-containing protein [Treponemataceae bacterium]|nr:HD domain-containing protein [Treponemataceae bacterium]
MAIEDLLSAGDGRLDAQLRFAAEIDKMTGVLRHTLLLDKSRRENDAEHSWHVAAMALLFAEYAREAPDVGRAVKMLVVHDLVEIYAGDTFAFDAEANSGKVEREARAADKLFSQLPPEQGAGIRALWEEFDRMDTPDSQYAACMDRLQPFLHNTLTDGHTWGKSGTTRAMVEARMEPVRRFLPGVWSWVQKNIDNGIRRGWIAP